MARKLPFRSSVGGRTKRTQGEALLPKLTVLMFLHTVITKKFWVKRPSICKKLCNLTIASSCCVLTVCIDSRPATSPSPKAQSKLFKWVSHMGAYLRRDQYFDGKKPQVVIKWLQELTAAYQSIQVPEGSTWRIVPYFLGEPAKSAYESAMESCFLQHGGFNTSPQGVNWLIRTYFSNEALSQALAEVEHCIRLFSQ